MTNTPPAEVTITMTEPRTVIAGSWTGMRPVGRARTYRATVGGVDFVNTRKGDIQDAIRRHLYRTTGSSAVRFTFAEVPE